LQFRSYAPHKQGCGFRKRDVAVLLFIWSGDVSPVSRSAGERERFGRQFDSEGQEPATLTVLSSMASQRILCELTNAYDHMASVGISIHATAGVQSHGRFGGRRSYRQRQHYGLRAVGNWRCSPRGFVATPHCERTSSQQAMQDTRRICYSTGPSGGPLKALCEKWGLVHTARALVAPSGMPVASLVARGEADLGFQQLSELIEHPGVNVVSPLPPEIRLRSRRVEHIRRSRGGPRSHCISGLERDWRRQAALRHETGMNPLEASA
jgi:molybdate transport system substrate-binding protein